MTTQTAIALLIQQKELLKSTSQGDPWLMNMAIYLEEIFGASSRQLKDFEELPRLNFTLPEYDIRVNQLSTLIDMWISNVNNGLFKKEEKKKGFFYSLSEDWRIAIVGIIITIIGGLSAAAGKYLSDSQNFDLKQQVKELQIQLDHINDSLHNPVGPV